jgi:DNA-binding response OmpR family regulator
MTRKTWGQDMLLLVIDDCEQIAHAVKRQLRHEFREVELAIGTDQGLAAIQRIKPDLIISDWNMPGGGGSKILDNSNGTPVVIHSAMDTEDPRTKEAVKRASAYVQKPANVKELTAALRKALSR